MTHKLFDAGLRWLVLLTLAAGAPAGAGQADALSVELRAGEVFGDTDTFRFKEGDEIRIRWTSDETVELHLHGYNLTATPGPGVPAMMAFTGTATGRFPVTRHAAGGDHHTLLYIEIHPR